LAEPEGFTLDRALQPYTRFSQRAKSIPVEAWADLKFHDEAGLDKIGQVAE